MKKVVVFLLIVMFCFSGVAVFRAFGDGQAHIHAEDFDDPDDVLDPDKDKTKPTTGSIENPTVILRLDDGLTEAVVDHDNKTVRLDMVIRDFDKVDCSEGTLTVDYDGMVFDFISVTGSLMSTDISFTSLISVIDGGGRLTITVRKDVTEPYEIPSEFSVYFSYVKTSLPTLTNFVKDFDFTFEFSGSGYAKEKNSVTRTVKATICPHEASHLKVIDYDATCEEYSHRDTVCDFCGLTLSSVATGNTYGDHVYDYNDIVRYVKSSVESFPFNCVTSGASPFPAEVKCEICGKLQWVSDLEYHTQIEKTKRYDASTNQYYFLCSRGHRIVAHIQAPSSTGGGTISHEHNYVLSTTYPATCTESGYSLYKCSICGEEKRETIAARGHTYGAPTVTVQPTCTQPGQQIKSCTVCNQSTITETIPALGHNFDGEQIISAPTCVSTGVASHTCTVDGYTEQYTLPIDPDAHSYGEWVVAVKGTCQTREVQQRTCALCGQVQTQTLDYGDHDYQKRIISEASCYEDGVSEYKCTYCNDTYQDVVKCTGHSFGQGVDDGKGTSTVTCSKCGLKIATTVKGNKTTKVITDGQFALTVNDAALVMHDIQLRVISVAEGSDEYKSDNVFIGALNSGTNKNYSIQNAYKVKLYIDGTESKFTENMTLALGIDTAVSKAKPAIVYFTSNGTSTVISAMKEARRSGTTMTMPGKALVTAANDTIILVVEGSAVTPTGTPTTPSTPSSGNGVVVAIIIIAVALVAAGVVVFIVIRKNKKSGFDF